ncbi:ATP-binding protein [Larsenimonas rhizosphaerae]|uniref:histidine kinase n=1 Tax=Larsenimonas rhizosphaerae TaxID=2944682 RepID=A0AA42CUK5_9GAMM|nr:ATP-binding protein [Larsenimonas rhizosphaerae]MCX2524782.1 ATP-binding protein [Larsenimonas rhizosphaerae]
MLYAPRYSLHFKVATLASILFLVGSMAIGWMIFQRQKVLENRTFENMSWIAYQLDQEANRFYWQLAATDSSSERLLLRYEILFSRIRLFRKGQVAHVITSGSMLDSDLEKVWQQTHRLDDLLAPLRHSTGGLSEDGKRRILATARDLRHVTARILLEVKAHVAALKSDSRQQLSSLYRWVLVMLGMMILSGLLLIMIVLRERRFGLEQAKRLRDNALALDKAVARARAASQSKTRFMAMMSHEIRNPLNGMIGMAELLEHESVSSQGRQYLQALLQSAHGLHGIIHNVLDHARLEQGAIVLNNSPFSLVNFIEKTCVYHRMQARQKGLDFNLTLADDLPDWVNGDTQRLRQILTNLLGNAIKFTDEGAVSLSVCHAGGQSLSIDVRDTGCGISRADLGALFEPFNKVGQRSHHKGAGLGLAISQWLAEAMGGDISAESTPGKGSCFCLTVPLAASDAPTALDEDTDDTVVTHGMKVLVVEDDSINRMLARVMLERLGVEVVLVEQGAEALEHADDPSFDLVFMDVNMPIMDGLQTTRRWRLGGGKPADIPIIGMTGNTSLADRRRCMCAGMNDVIYKPFLQRDVLSALYRYAGRRDAAPSPRAALQADVSSSSHGSSDISLAVLEDLESAVGHEALKELITLYQSRLFRRLDTLNTCLEQARWAALGREAHSFKGTSLSLGCQTMGALLEDMEQRVNTERGAVMKARLSRLYRCADQTFSALENYKRSLINR